MSAHANTERSVAELREMDEATAKRELSMVEYQRWESLNDHLNEAEQNREELAEADAEVHDMLVNADPRDYAAELSVWGNDLAVYYSPEDTAIRDAAERIAETFDVDLDGDLDAQAERITEDDVHEGMLDDAKDALVDLVFAAVVEWNGRRWDDLSPAEREHIRTTIASPRPDGWGLTGLMEGWDDIQTAVDEKREEKFDVVRKFRPEERGGDR
jgi:hypothetical protein